MTVRFHFIKKGAKLLGHILLGLAILIAAIVAAKLTIVPIVLMFINLDTEQVHNLGGFADIILTGLFYTAFVRFYEKRRVWELAFQGRAMMYGALAGLLMFSIPVISLFSMGYYEVVTFQGYNAMFFVIFGIGAIAIGEEFIFRGVIFRILEQYIGTLYALMFVSMLLGITSILSNDSLSLAGILTAMLTSALWCAIYVWSRNLWVVGLHHAAWNYAEFASGILDEHWRVSAPILSSAEGPSLLTGGPLGPESSILTLILCSTSLLLIYQQIQNLPSSQSNRGNMRIILNYTERTTVVPNTAKQTV